MALFLCLFCFLQQFAQRSLKVSILLRCTLGKSLCASAAAANLCGDCAKFQQSRNILLGVAFAVLIKDNGSFAEAHRRKTVVLSYGDIPCSHKVHKAEISAVRPLVNYDSLSALTLYGMGCVADYGSFQAMLFCCSDCDINYRTAVSVYKYPHTCLLFSHNIKAAQGLLLFILITNKLLIYPF